MLLTRDHQQNKQQITVDTFLWNPIKKLLANVAGRLCKATCQHNISTEGYLHSLVDTYCGEDEGTGGRSLVWPITPVTADYPQIPVVSDESLQNSV